MECYGMDRDEMLDGGWPRAGAGGELPFPCQPSRKKTFYETSYRMPRLGTTERFAENSASNSALRSAHVNSYASRLEPTSALELMTRPLHGAITSRPRSRGGQADVISTQTHSEKATDIDIIEAKEDQNSNRVDQQKCKHQKILFDMSQDPRIFYELIFAERENRQRCSNCRTFKSSPLSCPECGLYLHDSSDSEETFNNLKGKRKEKKADAKSWKKETVRKLETSPAPIEYEYFLPESFHGNNSPPGLGSGSRKISGSRLNGESLREADYMATPSPVGGTADGDAGTKHEEFHADDCSSWIPDSGSKPTTALKPLSNVGDGQTATDPPIAQQEENIINMVSEFNVISDMSVHSSSLKSFEEPSTNSSVSDPSSKDGDSATLDCPGKLTANRGTTETPKTELVSTEKIKDGSLTVDESSISSKTPITVRPVSKSSVNPSVECVSLTTATDINGTVKSANAFSIMGSPSRDVSPSTDPRKTLACHSSANAATLTRVDENKRFCKRIPFELADTKFLFEIGDKSCEESAYIGPINDRLKECYSIPKVGNDRWGESSDEETAKTESRTNYCSFDNPNVITVSRLSLPPSAVALSHMQQKTPQPPDFATPLNKTRLANEMSLLSTMNEATAHHLGFIGRNWKSSFKSYFDYFLKSLTPNDTRIGRSEDILRKNLIYIMNQHKDISLSIIDSVIEQTTSFLQRSPINR